MKFSKRVVTAMFALVILFTLAVLFIFYRTGSEPSTLIACVFAFVGVEGGALAWIRVTKEKTSTSRPGKREDEPTI